MAGISRFGVSIPNDLIKKFDRYIKGKQYSNRSEAIRDLIREKLVEQEWTQGKEIAGAILMVYDHHQRELVGRLVDVQHDHHEVIISSQHVHIDHHNCLETVIVRGETKAITGLAEKLRSTKGVKYCSLALATTGKEIV